MRICHAVQNRPAQQRMSSGISAALLSLVVLASGCGDDQVWREKSAVARQHLQLSENEEALGVLSSIDETDAPPEFRYLKSITLYRLGRTEAAGSEIALAIEEAPENPKFKGLQLLLRLMARQKDSVDQILELNEKYAAVGPVAFFATYAYHARASVLRQAAKPKASEYNMQRSRQTLATAMTLRMSMTEFHPDLFRLAMMQQQHQPALELLDGLLQIQPDSASLKMEKVKVLALLRKNDEAAEIAQSLFVEDGRQQDLAEFYAAVLSQTNPSEQHDEAFLKLNRQFSRNTQIAAKYAVYLARTGRLTLAEEHLEAAVRKQRNDEDKEALAFVAITLPLEGQAAEIAETRLQQYRPLLQDPLLVQYFEARILYLRRQYSEAMQRMLKIVEMSRNQGPGSRVMAKEALVWVRNILSDKLVVQQMQNALDAAQDREGDFESTEETAAGREAAPGKTPAEADTDQPESTATSQQSVPPVEPGGRQRPDTTASEEPATGLR